MAEDLPEDVNRVELDPEAKDSNGIPAPRVTYRLVGEHPKLLTHGAVSAGQVLEAAGASAGARLGPRRQFRALHGDGADGNRPAARPWSTPGTRRTTCRTFSSSTAAPSRPAPASTRPRPSARWRSGRRTASGCDGASGPDRLFLISIHFSRPFSVPPATARRTSRAPRRPGPPRLPREREGPDSSRTSARSFSRCGALRPEASFISIKAVSGSRATRRPRTAAVAGSGKTTGFGRPSPGYSPASRTSMSTPACVSRRPRLPGTSRRTRAPGARP